MKRNRLSEEQIIGVLKEQEAGMRSRTQLLGFVPAAGTFV
jgi:hypothetical protein